MWTIHGCIVPTATTTCFQRRRNTVGQTNLGGRACNAFQCAIVKRLCIPDGISTWASPPRTALCQDQRLEPVLRQSALVHDLTLHDRTALRWKLEQEKRLWIAFCTRQPKPTAETCSHVGHDLHGQFEQEGELTPIPDVHTHTNASATINGLKRVNCNVIKKIC